MWQGFCLLSTLDCGHDGPRIKAGVLSQLQELSTYILYVSYSLNSLKGAIWGIL